MYVLSDQTDRSQDQVITAEHFGANVVTIFDTEFGDPNSGMRELVSELNVSTLRFPGGTVTEAQFDMNNPDAVLAMDGSGYALLPMSQFLEGAHAIGSDVSIVLPTRPAFTQSPGEAALAGTYGSRDVSDAYLTQVLAFAEYSIDAALAAGVEIRSFEVGNEFWLGGQMTAAEYGQVAAQVAVLLDARLEALGFSEIDIIVQGTDAASRTFSPRDEAVAYIETRDDGELRLHGVREINEKFGGIVPDDFLEVTLPGQGTALDQLDDIIQAINAVPGAADAIDGSVLHVYQTQGFDGADTHRNFLFDQFERFESWPDRDPDLAPLDRHITEWNVQMRNHLHNDGLQQASMIVESFYEMVTHGVDAAQIWPLSFNNAQGTSLLDLPDDRLAISGEMFSLMSDVLVGTEAVLDWSMDGVLDVHGFQSSGMTHLFVSERSGEAQEDIRFDVSEIAEGTRFFVTQTHLWDGGAGGASSHAEPVVTYTDGVTLRGPELAFTLQDWSTARIDLIEVNNFANLVEAGAGDDQIHAFFGGDRLFGHDGDDIINGGGGRDSIWGGRGNDVIIGSRGKDFLAGNDGADTFMFVDTHGEDRIRDFRFGEDILRINRENYDSFDDLLLDPSLDLSFTENSVIVRYSETDSIELLGMTVTYSDDGGAVVRGDYRTNVLVGANSQDDLRGRNGNDVLVDGAGRDFLRGGTGADTFVLSADAERDTITDFEIGVDLIDITSWGVQSFQELDIDMQYNGAGRFLNRAVLRYENEELRLNTRDENFATALSSDDFIFV